MRLKELNWRAARSTGAVHNHHYSLWSAVALWYSSASPFLFPSRLILIFSILIISWDVFQILPPVRSVILLVAIEPLSTSPRCWTGGGNQPLRPSLPEWVSCASGPFRTTADRTVRSQNCQWSTLRLRRASSAAAGNGPYFQHPRHGTQKQVQGSREDPPSKLSCGQRRGRGAKGR